MSDEPPRATQLAPEWATRLLFAFVLLSLAALIVIPWHREYKLQPIRQQNNRVTDDGRRLVTRIHLRMAQEGSAVDDYVDDRNPNTLHRFREADADKKLAYDELLPIVATLGDTASLRMDHLLDLEQRWHAAIDTELFAEPTTRRRGQGQEALYDSMLVATAELDDAIAQSARDARDRIAEEERREQRTSVLLGVLALTAAAATWWLSRRTHA